MLRSITKLKKACTFHLSHRHETKLRSGKSHKPPISPKAEKSRKDNAHKCKRCQALIDYLFGTVETVIKPCQRMEPLALSNETLGPKNPQDNLLLTKSIDNNDSSDTPQAKPCKVMSTTNKEQEEKLAQKIETIKETPIVEAEKDKHYDFPPRILSKIYISADNMSKDRRETVASSDFSTQNSKVSVETEPGNSYEAKGITFEDPLSHMGDKLTKGMEILGVPKSLIDEKPTISSTCYLKLNREQSMNKKEVELESRASEIASNTCSSEQKYENINAKGRSKCQYNLNQHLAMYSKQVVEDVERKGLITPYKDHYDKNPFNSGNNRVKPSPKRQKRKKALRSHVLQHTCNKDSVTEHNTQGQKITHTRIEPTNTFTDLNHNKTTREKYIKTKSNEPRLVLELIIPPATAHKTDTIEELNINDKRRSNIVKDEASSDTINDGTAEEAVKLGIIKETYSSQNQPKTLPLKTPNDNSNNLSILTKAYINAVHLEAYSACLNQILLDEIVQQNLDKKTKNINITLKPDNSTASHNFFERRVTWQQTTPVQTKAYIDYLNHILQDGLVNKNTDYMIKDMKMKLNTEQNPFGHMPSRFVSEPTRIETNAANVLQSPVFHSNEENSVIDARKSNPKSVQSDTTYLYEHQQCSVTHTSTNNPAQLGKSIPVLPDLNDINREEASEIKSTGLLSNISDTDPIKTSDANQIQHSSNKSMLVGYPKVPETEADNLPTSNVNDTNTFPSESNTCQPLVNITQEQMRLEKLTYSYYLPNINLDPDQQTSDYNYEQITNVRNIQIDYPPLPDTSNPQTLLSTPDQSSSNNTEKVIRNTATDYPFLSNVILECKDEQKVSQSCTSSSAKCPLAPNQEHISVDKERPSFVGNRLPDKDPLLLDKTVNDPEQQHINTKWKSQILIENIPNVLSNQYEEDVSEKKKCFSNSKVDAVDSDISNLKDRPVSDVRESFYESADVTDESETLAQSLLEECSQCDYAKASMGAQPPLPSLNPANNKLSLTEMLRRVRLRSQIENIRQYKESKLITMSKLMSLKSLESLEKIDVDEINLKEEMYGGEKAYPREINDSENLEVTGKKCKTRKPPCPPPSAPQCPPTQINAKPQRIPCPKSCQPTCPSGCPPRPPSCPPKGDPCSRFTQTNMEHSFLKDISNILSHSPLSRVILSHTLSTPKIEDIPLEQCIVDSIDSIDSMDSMETPYLDYEDWDFGEVSLARDFEPWVPIPSWLPWPVKKPTKHPFMCPKEGCKDRAPYRLDPCAERGGKPCSNFPKRDR